MLNVNLDDLPPDEFSWGKIDFSDLDLVYSYKKFLGKTNREAIDIASKYCIIEYVDEIRWMPKEPFKYYVVGLSFHVSEMNYDGFDSSMYSDAYLTLIDKKIHNHSEWFDGIYCIIDDCMSVILNNSVFFNIDSDIYGEVEPRIFKIREFWKSRESYCVKKI